MLTKCYEQFVGKTPGNAIFLPLLSDGGGVESEAPFSDSESVPEFPSMRTQWTI